MTEEQGMQIWNALHSGKTQADRAYGMSRHIEGSSEHYKMIKDEIIAAMDLVNKITDRRANPQENTQ